MKKIYLAMLLAGITVATSCKKNDEVKPQSSDIKIKTLMDSPPPVPTPSGGEDRPKPTG